MAAQLPQIYELPSEEKKKDWHIDRVRWTINAWMQMWSQLFAYLPHADQTDPSDNTDFTVTFATTWGTDASSLTGQMS